MAIIEIDMMKSIIYLSCFQCGDLLVMIMLDLVIHW